MIERITYHCLFGSFWGDHQLWVNATRVVWMMGRGVRGWVASTHISKIVCYSNNIKKYPQNLTTSATSQNQESWWVTQWLQNLRSPTSNCSPLLWLLFHPESVKCNTSEKADMQANIDHYTETLATHRYWVQIHT